MTETDALFVQWYGKDVQRPPSPVQPYGIKSVWAHADDLEQRLRTLEQERDEALMIAEGPSTLRELANGFGERGMQLAAAQEALCIAAEEDERQMAEIAALSQATTRGLE